MERIKKKKWDENFSQKVTVKIFSTPDKRDELTDSKKKTQRTKTG